MEGGTLGDPLFPLLDCVYDLDADSTRAPSSSTSAPSSQHGLLLGAVSHRRRGRPSLLPETGAIAETALDPSDTLSASSPLSMDAGVGPPALGTSDIRHEVAAGRSLATTEAGPSPEDLAARIARLPASSRAAVLQVLEDRERAAVDTVASSSADDWEAFVPPPGDEPHATQVGTQQPVPWARSSRDRVLTAVCAFGTEAFVDNAAPFRVEGYSLRDLRAFNKNKKLIRHLLRCHSTFLVQRSMVPPIDEALGAPLDSWLGDYVLCEDNVSFRQWAPLSMAPAEANMSLDSLETLATFNVRPWDADAVGDVYDIFYGYEDQDRFYD